MTRAILVLRPNGDPYGMGYYAIEYKDQSEYLTGYGSYRGDIGNQSRSYWRAYARRNNYILRSE